MWNHRCHRISAIFLLAMLFLLVSCSGAPKHLTATAPTSTAPAQPAPATLTQSRPTLTPELSAYAFPESIDPGRHYLFYLHGRIIEEQGIHAVSPDFGEYEYEAILEKLSSYGFIVISEVRSPDTDARTHAQRIELQVLQLLEAGVPPENITVVGASKGAGIAAYASHALANEKLNFVLMAICSPEMAAEWRQNQYYLSGNVLSLYDSADTLGGSCQDIFSISDGHGLAKHEEIVLHVGAGHGILYRPLDVWIIPVVEWAGQK